MTIAINPNLSHLVKSFNQGKKGVVLEGSSRSGKTWAGIDFLVWLCTYHEKLKIAIVRETYNSFKTTLYLDMGIRLDQYGIPHPFHRLQDISFFPLLGNTIYFIGANDISTKIGAGFDMVFYNEAIHIPRKLFNHLEMRRCRFWWMDYNPEVATHWIYDNVIPRSDVAYLKTTFLDNPMCPPESRVKILGYEPWLPGSYNIVSGVVMFNGQPISDGNQPPPHPKNVAEGTADEFDWMVYGLGLKAELKGRIFKVLYRCKQQPADAKYVGDGMDYGGSPDPLAGVRVWHNVDAEGKECIYIKEMVFGNDLGASEIADMWLAAGYKNNDFPDPDDMVHDTNEPNTTAYLKKERGFRMWKAKKGQGSVIANIRTLKSYKIFILEDSKNCFSAFENYCWEWNQLTDQSTGQPMKKFKHFPDATAYVLVRAFGWKNTSVYDSE